VEDSVSLTLAPVSARKFRTNLEQIRWTLRETQRSMSEKTGIPLRTYRRLENGELDNPPITYLVNCAIVLNQPLEAVCERAWLSWSAFDPRVEPRTHRVQLVRATSKR